MVAKQVISVICPSEFWCKFCLFGYSCRNYCLQKWAPFLLKMFIQNLNIKRDIINSWHLGLISRTGFVILFPFEFQPDYRLLTTFLTIFLQYFDICLVTSVHNLFNRSSL